MQKCNLLYSIDSMELISLISISRFHSQKSQAISFLQTTARQIPFKSSPPLFIETLFRLRQCMCVCHLPHLFEWELQISLRNSSKMWVEHVPSQMFREWEIFHFRFAMAKCVGQSHWMRKWSNFKPSTSHLSAIDPNWLQFIYFYFNFLFR